MSTENTPLTEAASIYNDLEKMEVSELLENINREDQKVATAVSAAIPQITLFVNGLVDRMRKGGRLFYIGAGTSGRLGILDASEIPPTYGASPDMVLGLIAGGDKAIRSAVEGAEDDKSQAWKDLLQYNPSTNDIVVGIAASGRTPYVVGGLEMAEANGLFTACITCNKDSAVTKVARIALVAEVGPEFVTGSTRMKAGTAQKMVLNMISTAVMIKLGKVKGNKMVDMQLSNEKLVDRGVRMLTEALGEISYEQAKKMLVQSGSVRKAIEAYRKE